MGQTKRISTQNQTWLEPEWSTSKAVAAALSPLDQVAAKMEGKWGCDRLPRLVTTELATRFGTAAEKLDHAIRANNVDEIRKRAEIMIRGWEALDQAATEAGHSSMPPEAWSVPFEGKTYAIVLNRRDHDIVSRLSPPPAIVVTVNELLLAWSQWAPARFVEKTKAAFPGSEARRSRSGGFKDLDDEIPF